MMRWLVGPAIAGLVGSLLAIRIAEHLFGGAQGALVNTAKVSIFVTTWTAIMTGSGMHAFSKWVRGLRQKTMSLNRWLHAGR